MQLAWFTPWPPDRHPAARRSRDLVRALTARGHEIDLFVAEDATGQAAPPPALLVSTADAERRLARHTPDLIVYHVVRSRAGAFVWPHLAARPGLALLHDVQLYEAFAATAPPAAARETGAASARAGAAFRSEFAWSQPEAGANAAELAIAGFTGAYSALWPMTRLVVERSRAVAVPTAADADAFAARWPDAAVGIVAAGLDGPSGSSPPQPRASARAHLGLPDDAVVFAVCLEPDDEPDRRRIPQILRAFATAIGRVPTARLLLCGESVAGVPPDLSHGVLRTGSATEAGRWSVMHAADVLVDLHWPRTSGPSDALLAAAALGRPAILMDSVATADLPLLDPRSWRQTADGRASLGVAVDILDEEHSLRHAMYRLAIDAELRARLGEAAEAHWQRHHTMERMTSDLLAAIDRALATADFD